MAQNGKTCPFCGSTLAGENDDPYCTNSSCIAGKQPGDDDY